MARTNLRERIFQRAVEAGIEQETVRRKATGKKFCKDKFYGFVSGSAKCRACCDEDGCISDTQKRIQTIGEQLYKLFGDDGYYDSDDWIDTTEINIARHRERIIEFIKGKMDGEDDPDLLYKIKEIPPLTNKTLDALVPEWKEFRQQKPKIDKADVFHRVCRIYHDSVDKVLEAVEGCDNIEAAWPELLENSHLSHKRKKIVTGLHQKLLEYAEQLKETFPEEFGRAKKDENYWPAKWMTNDKGINAILNRWEHFSPILNILWRKRKRLDYQESLGLGEKIGCGVYGERHYVLLPITHEAIATELGKSPQLVQKYLKMMCVLGILKLFHRPGPNGFTVYSIGYWSEWQKNKYKVVPFLQERVYGRKGNSYQKLVDFMAWS